MKTGSNPSPKNKSKGSSKVTYQFDEYVLLPRDNGKLGVEFFELVSNRKSGRQFSVLSLQQVSDLLWHAAKAKKVMVDEENRILSHRASPSAGGIHPIDIFISLPNIIADRALHYYDPYSHSLGRLILDLEDRRMFFDNINRCLPISNSTLIWFVADPNRTGDRYENWESLIWRDAGALIMLVQLVASALSINSCPLGTLGEPFFARSFGVELFSAGGLLLG